MRKLLSVSALLFAALLVSPARAQDIPHVKLPDKLEAKPAQVVKLSADTTEVHVRWVVFPSREDVFLLLFDKDKSAVFQAMTPGTYHVLAYTAKGDVPSLPSVCVITVQGPQPPPPGPGPGPGPDPGPDPNPALTAALRSAWARDGKDPRVGDLAALYKAAADDIGGDASDKFKTVGQVFLTVSAARKRLMPDDALVAVRGALQDFFKLNLPSDSEAPLDDATRRKVVDAFGKAHLSLSRLK